jgi:hypothetical protein
MFVHRKVINRKEPAKQIFYLYYKLLILTSKIPVEIQRKIRRIKFVNTVSTDNSSFTPSYVLRTSRNTMILGIQCTCTTRT